MSGKISSPGNGKVTITITNGDILNDLKYVATCEEQKLKAGRVSFTKAASISVKKLANYYRSKKGVVLNAK